MIEDMVKELELTKNWGFVDWDRNLPLQAIREIDGWTIVNYMPCKHTARELVEVLPQGEIEVICKNTAKVLRNLAELFEAFGRGEIDRIYCPTETLESIKNDEAATANNLLKPKKS